MRTTRTSRARSIVHHGVRVPCELWACVRLAPMDGSRTEVPHRPPIALPPAPPGAVPRPAPPVAHRHSRDAAHRRRAQRMALSGQRSGTLARARRARASTDPVAVHRARPPSSFLHDLSYEAASDPAVRQDHARSGARTIPVVHHRRSCRRSTSLCSCSPASARYCVHPPRKPPTSVLLRLWASTSWSWRASRGW